MPEYQNLDTTGELRTLLREWHKSYRERTIAEQAKAKALQDIANKLGS